MRLGFGTLLLIVGLASQALGTFGFHLTDPPSGWATAFYRSAQLFYWNSSFGPDVPWPLEIARWTAPATTFGALFQLAIAVFRRRWNAARARWCAGHVVICGPGRVADTLIPELIAEGRRVVVLDGRSEPAAAPGALVVAGDAATAEGLRAAGAPRARAVVVCGAEPHRNLAAAVVAARLGAGAVHAQCDEATLADLFQRNHLLALPGNAGCVRLFNLDRNVARCTLRDFPLDARDGGQAHVVLPDLSALGRALLVEIALMGHFPGDGRVTVHVVAAGANDQVAAFRVRYPGVDRCVGLQAVELPVAETFAARVAGLGFSPGDRVVIFPDLAGEERGLSRALEVIERLPTSMDVHVLLPSRAGSAIRLVVEQNPALAGRIAFLPDPRQTAGREAILRDSLDRTAREIHERWRQETARQITAARACGDEDLARRHEAKATFRPWEALSEEQRGASRSQADHIPFKVRAAGLDPRTATADDWAHLDATVVERLARMEHARWAAYYWMTGWTYGADRDDAARRHPNLVAYDDLDEPTKDYDREAVRNVGAYLNGPMAVRTPGSVAAAA